MSVGWLKVRRTDNETFEKHLTMPHALIIYYFGISRLRLLILAFLF